MRGFMAFTKKEFMEYIRSYKLLIVLLVFLAVGFLNPITAKYLPQLLETFMDEGIIREIPEPVIMDVWVQFFKNVPQMGLFVVVIVFSGSIPAELLKGTLIPVLTKGLRRKAVWLSKFTGAVIVWTVSYVISFAVTYFYSLLFWEKAGVPRLGLAVFFAWIFGVLLLCLVFLGGTISKSYAGGLLMAGAFLVSGMILNMFQTISRYSPLMLVNGNTALMEGSLPLHDFLPAAITAVVLGAAAVVAGIIIFDKKQL